MTRDNIQANVKKLLSSRLGVSPVLLCEPGIETEPLTGPKLSLDGLALTYLFYETEKAFGLKIDANKLLNYEFNTIDGITDIIESVLER